jgi:hypothetical protein
MLFELRSCALMFYRRFRRCFVATGLQSASAPTPFKSSVQGSSGSSGHEDLSRASNCRRASANFREVLSTRSACLINSVSFNSPDFCLRFSPRFLHTLVRIFGDQFLAKTVLFVNADG